MTEPYNPPHPTHRDPGWFERSSWADRAWKLALKRYWEERARIGYPWLPEKCSEQAAADARVRSARAEYRHQILGWYTKLCLPLRPDEVVPNEVARLQWEQWDLDGCDAADAVNLDETGGDFV